MIRFIMIMVILLSSWPNLARQTASGTDDSVRADAIIEPERSIPITHRADVVVVGATTGGFGGCMAAIAAARQGCSVILIESAGAIEPHTPLGLGVSFGNAGRAPTIAEGQYRDFARYVAETGQYNYRPLTFEEITDVGELLMRYHDVIGTAMLRMMQDAGVQLLFHTRFSTPFLERNQLKAILVESPQGRHAIAGKVFIDSTGLGDVAAASGVPMSREEPYLGLQSYIGHVDDQRYHQWVQQHDKPLDASFQQWLETIVGPFSELEHPWNQWWPDYLSGRRMPPAVVRKIREAHAKGEFTIIHHHGENGILAIPEGIKTDPGVARPRSYVTGLDPLSVDDMSWAEVTSRIALMEFHRFYKNHIPGFELSVMERMAGQISYRGGRWLQPVAGLSPADLQPKAKNADCIFLYQRTEDEDSIIEIPYRMLWPQRVDGLLVVGKASAGRELDHPQGVLFQGQAAGTAAAIAVRNDVPPKRIDVRELQSALKANGVRIPY